MTDQDIILIADARILAVTVKESEEPMVDIINQSAIAYGPSPEIPNNTDYTKMRKAVYQRLVEAQKTLPQGIYFCLYEAYRSLSLQKKLFDNRYQIIESHHPEWTKEQVFVETTKMVSPVVNLDGSDNIPPHSTGAAIDVSLIDEQGQSLDMGIHPENWIEDENDLLSFTNSTRISEEARLNRQIMSRALSAVGFVNYPTEYWHWSYGDRYWAYHKNESYAIYDIVSDKITVKAPTVLESSF